MKIALKSQPPSAGYALMLTLMFLGITLLGFGSIMAWVSSSSVITDRNNLHVASQAAAESATEQVIASMMRDFTYTALHPASTYQAMVPSTNGWPVVFTFQSTNGLANQTSVSIGAAAWKELPSQFSGLSGYGQDCIVASTAITAGQRYAVPSTVSQAIWFGNIPLFQFAIFYNQDMEINPGGSMNINGRVHSNYNIWATGNSSSQPVSFNDVVDASGFATNRSSTLDPRSPIRTGNAVYSNTNNPVSNADSLTLPVGIDSDNNPTNVESILRLPPTGVDPDSTNGQVYLYNTSDLVISNSPNGINDYSPTNVLTVYYQNPNAVNRLTPVVPDVSSVQTVSSNSYVLSFTVVTNLVPTYTYTTNIDSYVTGSRHNQHTVYTTNITAHAGTPITQVVTNSITNVVTSTITFTNYYYSFVTNQTFYDYREGKTVQAVQVDVGKLNTWLGNNSATGGKQYDDLNSADKTHGINSIYAYSDVGLDDSTLPAVRVTDGAQLPDDGLTVSTQLPLYVKGDYNTTDGSGTSTASGDTVHTKPAALLGDAITILSSHWSDSYNSGTSAGSRSVTSANTTINAATMEGIVPSDGTYYSGGVENFMRLLEQWSGHTLTYNGSIVVMFPSQYATTPWQKNGNYYSVPTRQWGFDNNFKDSSKLPPLTPQLKATVRGTYVTK
jgi:hypothetical protein